MVSLYHNLGGSPTGWSEMGRVGIGRRFLLIARSTVKNAPKGLCRSPALSSDEGVHLGERLAFGGDFDCLSSGHTARKRSTSCGWRETK